MFTKESCKDENLFSISFEINLSDSTAMIAISLLLNKFIEHLKIKNIYGMIKIYIDQSQKAYSELYLFLQNDMKTMCLEEGCFLGDPSEERTNQSTEMDFLSFFEAWFLQCETFGTQSDLRKSAHATAI